MSSFLVFVSTCMQEFGPLLQQTKEVISKARVLGLFHQEPEPTNRVSSVNDLDTQQHQQKFPYKLGYEYDVLEETPNLISIVIKETYIHFYPKNDSVSIYITCRGDSKHKVYRHHFIYLCFFRTPLYLCPLQNTRVLGPLFFQLRLQKRSHRPG